MSSPLARFAFVDTIIAAEVLHVTTDTLLDWIAQGRLKTYGGKASNPFLRSADVATLAAEIGVSEDEAPKRTRSATARVQARLTADSRWADIPDDDIRDWAHRADGARRQAARTTAGLAIQRLETLLRALDDVS